MWKQIFKTTLIAGSLDITAACISAYVQRDTTPATVLQYIASGMLGKDAYTGGYGTMALGLLFHFIIAFSCTAVFFSLYPKLKMLHHNILLNSLLIALIAWAATTQVVIPLSKIEPAVFNAGKAVIAAGILFICIGLPISITAKKFYSSPKPNA